MLRSHTFEVNIFKFDNMLILNGIYNQIYMLIKCKLKFIALLYYLKVKYPGLNLS